MDMGLDESTRDQPSRAIDFARISTQCRFDGDDATALDTDIDQLFTCLCIETRVAQDQIDGRSLTSRA